MSAIAFTFLCADCHSEFKAPEVPECSYGIFVMRTKNSLEVLFLDSFNDSVFDEVCKIVETHPLIGKLTAGERAKVQQEVFSLACDKTSEGELFEIGLSPKCPSCGSHKMKSWQQITPVEKIVLPPVMHVNWNNKLNSEKNVEIDKAIKCFIRKNSFKNILRP